jgi:DNA-binding MarR family transcriptional regulator
LNPHIGQLLRDAFDDFERRLTAAVIAAGAAEMRPKYNAVLRYLDAGGTRASVLAERSGLTRQALTQIVDELEEAGLVGRVPDPEDRRAKLVVYTERGQESFKRSRRMIAAIEAEYESLVGERGYGELRETLAKIIRPDS